MKKLTPRVSFPKGHDYKEGESIGANVIIVGTVDRKGNVGALMEKI